MCAGLAKKNKPASRNPVNTEASQSSAGMVESIDAAGDDLKKGAGAGAGEAAAAAVSIGSYLWWYAPRCIPWTTVVWIKVNHLINFGAWSALAFLVLQAVVFLVLPHLRKRRRRR